MGKEASLGLHRPGGDGETQWVMAAMMFGCCVGHLIIQGLKEMQ